MRIAGRVGLVVVALLAATGCAKTTMSDREMYTGGPLPRPDRILVYDFAANAADIPSWSVMAGTYPEPTTPQTAQEIELGRKMGALVASELVGEIQKMGLPAVLANGQPPARPGDIVIIGYFEAVDTGSMAKRIVLGFGAGAADLKTVVEGYLMTDRGMRRLGSGVVDSGGNKMPGVAIPLAVAAATDNPIGLIVSGAVKVGGEVSGQSTIEGSAKRTAKEIGEQLRWAFQRQGWIASQGAEKGQSASLAPSAARST
ncbi:MAG TPA: DUF4410 domain-containing protein [Candidatus Methylomirabilis sp.]|nr:DUF4410 domain-containing protein [Candidatus Methylomirabilis sp.]